MSVWPHEAEAAPLYKDDRIAALTNGNRKNSIPMPEGFAKILPPEVAAVLDLDGQLSDPEGPPSYEGLEDDDDADSPDGQDSGEDSKSSSQGGRTTGTAPLPSSTRSGNELELQRRGIVPVELRPSQPMLLSVAYPATVASVEVRDGDTVVEGQAVATLDAANFIRSLEEARIGMETAVERVQRAGVAGQREQEAAAAALARSADALREAEERLAGSSLTAPFAGRVTEVRAHAGQHLKRGEVVMELARQGDMEIVGQIPSTWIAQLDKGHIIWVYVEETAKSYEAEILRFGGRVNPSTRTIRAYARFLKTPEELLPGMSGRADFFPRPGK